MEVRPYKNFFMSYHAIVGAGFHAGPTLRADMKVRPYNFFYAPFLGFILIDFVLVGHS